MWGLYWAWTSAGESAKARLLNVSYQVENIHQISLPLKPQFLYMASGFVGLSTSPATVVKFTLFSSRDNNCCTTICPGFSISWNYGLDVPKGELGVSGVICGGGSRVRSERSIQSGSSDGFAMMNVCTSPIGVVISHEPSV